MNEYGYRRGTTGYVEYTNTDIDTATQSEILRNIELNNQENEK